MIGPRDLPTYKSGTNPQMWPLLKKIEKYSVQNATIYEYFYDKWVDFDEVMDNIPIHVSNPNAFLKANKYVEVADSSYCYLLNIKEYLPFGSVEPYDYASFARHGNAGQPTKS